MPKASAPRLNGLLPLITHSPSETRDLGEQIAQILTSAVIVALYGDLGAGKTEFVKGVCRGLGVNEELVHSPTFTIVNEYRGAVRPIFHFDAYRIDRLEEFFDLGYEDYFYSDAITLVEWADRVETLLPAEAVRIRLSHAGEGKRLIEAVTDYDVPGG